MDLAQQSLKGRNFLHSLTKPKGVCGQSSHLPKRQKPVKCSAWRSLLRSGRTSISSRLSRQAMVNYSIMTCQEGTPVRPGCPQKPIVEAKCSAACRLLVRPVFKHLQIAFARSQEALSVTLTSDSPFPSLIPFHPSVPRACRKTAETSIPREKKKHITRSGSRMDASGMAKQAVNQ